MKTKKTFLKIGIFAIFMGIFSLSFTTASAFTRFKIDISKNPISAVFESDITKNIMYVHFADNGNDFGGILYFSNIGEEDSCEDDTCEPEFIVSTKNIEEINPSDRNIVYECRKQMKGFYYNSQRGERLWPLDDTTARLWGSGYSESFTGGIYTNCTEKGYYLRIIECGRIKEFGQEVGYSDATDYELCISNANQDFKSDNNGYFGSVSNTYSGQEMALVIGVNYTGTDSSYNGFISIESGSKLAPTFARFGNKYPVGFIYDYNGGLGLAGCRITGDFMKESMKILYNEYYNGGIEGLSNIFVYDEENDKVAYKPGSIEGVSCDAISQADTLLRIVIEGIVGMSETASNKMNTIYGTMGNSSNSKMQQFATRDINRNTLMNYVRKKAELLCRGKWKKIEDSDCEHLPSLICDNGTGSPNCRPRDLQGKTIIVKDGNLRIYPNEDDRDMPYDIYILSGDLIINELDDRLYVFNESGYVMDDISTGDFNYAVWTGGGYYKGGSGATVASFIKGNFIVNGNIIGSGNTAEEKKLKHKYFIYGKLSSRDNVDNLEETFARRCYNGSGSDGNYCPKYDGNSYWNASLIVMDQNFPSPVMN